MRKILNEELERLSLDEFQSIKKAPMVVVMDNVRSAINIGSAFRTGDAFAIEGLYLCGICATPPHKDIAKSALGAQDSLYWKHFESTKEAILELKANGYKIVLVEQINESISLEKYSFSSDEALALVFGNEVFGVSDDCLSLADAAIEIPQFGTKHSLNVSVSLGVVLWEWSKAIRIK